MASRVAPQQNASSNRFQGRNDSQSQQMGDVSRVSEWNTKSTAFSSFVGLMGADWESSTNGEQAESSSRIRPQRNPSKPVQIPRPLGPAGPSADDETTSFLPHGNHIVKNASRISNIDGQFEPTNRSRQSSIQPQGTPMGPRPLDAGGKRSISHVNSPYLSSLSSNSNAQYRRGESINSISRFSFASIAPEAQNSWQGQPTAVPELGDDSPVPTNFDDFHNNITSTDAQWSILEAPTNNLPKSDDKSVIPLLANKTGSVRKTSGTGSTTRSGSSRRQQSTASSAAKTQTLRSNPDFLQTSTASELRSRRQSHLPPNSFNNTNPAPKAPKRFTGPDPVPAADSTQNLDARRRPNAGTRKSAIEKNSSEPSLRQNIRPRENGDKSKAVASMRGLKVKSLQPPTVENSGDSLNSRLNFEPPLSSPSNQARTPAKTLGRPATPSSSGKRLSIMPPHATGLGARTVSPTDARRLRRLSMMPHAPPLPTTSAPHTPITSQLEPPPLTPRSAPRSPSLNGRKSVTPPSSRNTPDPNRKSYSSGQSLSSTTSYSSAKNSGGPALRQTSGSTSSSRRQTPKPRTESGNVNEMEEVPPVPAIPKAYESPSSETDQPFFSAHSSTLPHIDTPIDGSPTVQSLADAIAALDIPKEPSPPSHKSSVFPDTELRSIHTSRKAPQPIRLPPINLLPLSTPTAAKIMALDNVKSPEDGEPSPPPREIDWKVPSTPMTASRVNFPSKAHLDTQASPSIKARSNSSHLSLQGDSDAFAASLGGNNKINFSFGPTQQGPRNISPFISSSLPKSSREFATYMQPKYGADLNRQISHAKPSGPRVPSFSQTNSLEPKPVKDATESFFSAPAIRRKLSLTRRRSSSKTWENADSDAAAKYKAMPPPKLPASATWNNLVAANVSPTQKKSYLKSRRKSSVSSFGTAPGIEEQPLLSEHARSVESRPSMDSNFSTNIRPSRSSSLISPAASALSSSSGGQLQSRDAAFDRDDLLAEEEMRKLAMRRKDVETLARDLDDLRQRARPREHIFPLQALQKGNLNIFERGEIVDYEHVYFTGARRAQKIVGDTEAASTNFGYDDERGDYNIIRGDHLAFRYEVVDLLGKGSFGQVVRCIDHKTGILVAVKIIRNKKRFHQQALVEVSILQKLREWDPEKEHSVVSFDQSFYFRGHLCISTDLLDMNLYEFIKAHDFGGFSLKLIRRFTKQLLDSLVLLNSRKVIHCDLKPENILLAHPLHSDIKVIDFGSSCFENEKVYTYIQSRFYRSPEVILGMSYGMPIDMWSLGCILAELHTGYPIFPGENEQEQLACIMEIFGPPEKHLIEKSTRKKLFFDSLGKPRLTVSSKGRRRRPSSKELRQVLKCDDEAFLDFVSKCLRWDPARRLNPHQAMMHDYVTGGRPGTRRPHATGSTSSPVKRGNSISASVPRPLPQLPSTSGKNALNAWPTEPFPHQGTKSVAKRTSTINGLQPAYNARRSSHVTSAVTGPIPRKMVPTQKSVSGNPDLATAAAAAATLRL